MGYRDRPKNFSCLVRIWSCSALKVHGIAHAWRVLMKPGSHLRAGSKRIDTLCIVLLILNFDFKFQMVHIFAAHSTLIESVLKDLDFAVGA
jgi:hypothetical protein